MEYYREKYKNAKGKTDSMYIYILYRCPQEKIKEHIKKQLDILERVNDAHKRKMFTSRYQLLKNMVDQNSDDHIYDNIIFISDDIDTYDILETQKNLLKKFDHHHISFVYDNHFKLDYVEDLLFNNIPCHIYRVNNNKIDYIQITKTKKVIISSKESKPLNIKEFIDSTLPTNTKYIIHGISSKLKDLTDTRAYTVINRTVRDEELLDMINKMDQENILISLKNDLAMMNDSKQMHKIIFKKEIPGKIKNSQLQKLYIDSKLVEKFLANMKKNALDTNFKLIIIDSSIKSFVDGQENILDKYEGVVGITYY